MKRCRRLSRQHATEVPMPTYLSLLRRKIIASLP